ncbi:hypothetical protein [Runella limosa]|uniref:hypothetical protein n=1 Tax=Runella limosa TaxID=370978 RepID=UPI00042971FB|nr:hypothetical protein [Runella limosa]
MPNRTYISLNQEGTSKETRDLRADVGEFAYANQGVIVAPFDVVELGIGSWRYDAESWDGVQNPPNLQSKGHFLVWVTAENTKEIRFVADETRDESCVESRVGELIVIEGVAESWNYYVSNNETYKFGEIAVPGSYDKGKANDTKLRTLSADHVRQYAYMNRGKRVDVVNFNTTLTHGNTHVEFLAGSIGSPPTTENKGILRNEIAGCVVHQYWYPVNSDALFFRERSEAKVWGSWYSATSGNVLSNGKVRVPTYYKRGVGNGYQDVEVYSANQVDTKFKVLSGTGTNVVQTDEGFIVNWTGTTQSLGADLPLLYDPITGKISISPTKVSQWDAAYNYGPHAGLYAPIGRNLTVGGTAGRIAVSGGRQSLAADRSWAVDLVAIHAGLTAGSTTQVAVPTVDVYGRVTALTNASIAFPVTSVNGKTGAVALSTTDVPEGTNLYWTNARGDVRYSPLGHTHTWAQITDKPDLAGLYVPVVRTLSFLGAAGQIDITGGSQSLISNRTWTVGLATVHAGLTAGSSTQVAVPTVDTYGRVTALTNASIAFPVTSVNGKTGAVSLSTTDVPEGTNLYWTTARGDARYSLLGHTHTWAQISGVPAFLLQAYTTVQADTLPVNQRSNLNFSQEFAIADSSANNRTTVSISAVPYAKVTGVPAFLLTETDPTVPSYVKAISTADISTWSGKIGGSGTLNYVPKFTGSGSLGDSRIVDNGTVVNIASSNTTGLLNVGGDTNIFGRVAVGGNDSGGYQLRIIGGAIYSDGDASAVSMYVPSGRAIRAQGTLNIDAGTSAPILFRSGGGASYLMELNSNGKLRFNSYYSATAWTGSPVALLGTDNGGNVLTLSTLLYADRIHGHGIGDISGLQTALDGKTPWGHTHVIGDVTGLQAALDGKTPWGHNHDDRYFTQGQLTTSGGSTVHWDNITNKPGFSYAGHTHTIPDVSGLQSALDGKTLWGHTHAISDITGLQPALDNRPTWDAIYTRSQSDSRYLQSENDPFGYSSHWFSISGRNLTLGFQTRNLGQGYASVTLPISYQYDIATQQLLNGNHLIRLNRDDGYYIDRTITETDPKGVSSCYGSYSSGTLSITIVLRDGTSISCNIPFSGPS